MSDRKLIDLAQRCPEQALEALNRVTGLTWDGLPRSLLPEVRMKRGSAAQRGSRDVGGPLRQTG